MHCVKPEQDNFTYYPVNHVSVPVPTLARENCRCALLQTILRCVTEKNIAVCVIVVVAGWLRCKQFRSKMAMEGGARSSTRKRIFSVSFVSIVVFCCC